MPIRNFVVWILQIPVVKCIVTVPCEVVLKSSDICVGGICHQCNSSRASTESEGCVRRKIQGHASNELHYLALGYPSFSKWSNRKKLHNNISTQPDITAQAGPKKETVSTRRTEKPGDAFIRTWSGYVIRDDTCTLTLASRLTLPYCLNAAAGLPQWRDFDPRNGHIAHLWRQNAIVSAKTIRKLR
ncbi:hypothetical protein JTE90_000507 [Oedothorax gibbosus]|uniref:Secreted protein n=1 Tax=Oedothorax gibbosus TaxID=931172 RepID=A0AAV6VXG8_9ARAC|nr:hypothetical protein JTE90_000507 [Oedothorax gibbosus]